jgi:putative restriction endonuclease
MGKELYIGNTDFQWFSFLKANSPLSEVNFWQPSVQHFKALVEGGVFAFRLKAPINKIAGFGTLAASGNITITQSWNDLGFSNGVQDMAAMIKLVSKYRPDRPTDQFTRIGFKLLVDPVFLNEEDWIDVPRDWAPSIVIGKSYSSNSDEGARILRELSAHNRSPAAFNLDRSDFEGFSDGPRERFGAKTTIIPRKGQNEFRLKISSAYESTCAVSGCKTPQVLDAAHIDPYSDGGLHGYHNGILLRADLHRLFDQGLISIDDNYCVVLSPALKDHDNSYNHFEGQKIKLPKNRALWPSLDALQRQRMSEI